ncbi:hypothetical protein Glove_276g104 [Diversispora epigaea]|uniref:Uncharacterized protein n=1 Tax=Diversispora epigaea TaxID=1348612 RepID=A0A397I462_9GLOM|nr:hypothetical protein Glove_276g104 [Diversispora epigaea]
MAQHVNSYFKNQEKQKKIDIPLFIIQYVIAVTANKTKTLTKTRGNTRTIYPTNCKATTITSKTIVTTTNLSIFRSTINLTFTTTTITTTSPISNPTLCYIDRNDCYFKNKYTKIVFCKPTVYLPCPKAFTETLTTCLPVGSPCEFKPNNGCCYDLCGGNPPYRCQPTP